MENVKHTPTPWHVGPHYTSDIESSEGRVAECRPLMTPRGIANAEFIVRAVNCHDDLVKALRMCARFFGDESNHWEWGNGRPFDTQLIRDALAKADPPVVHPTASTERQ